MRMNNYGPRTAIILALALAFLACPALAQRNGDRSMRTPVLSRFTISAGGGAAFAEDHRAMAQLLAELQYNFSSRFRLGLGLGYLSAGGHGEQMGRDRWMGGSDGMNQAGMTLIQRLFNRSASEQGRDFRLVPISLNAYYVLPLARRWDAFLSGGAGYYLGTFYGDSARLSKNAWGGQAGLGIEFRLNPRMRLVAQGGYRFVAFNGLKFERPLGVLDFLAAASGVGNLVSFLAPLLQPKPVDVRLNGFSLSAGVRFGI
jgi:hypothetical protein